MILKLRAMQADARHPLMPAHLRSASLAVAAALLLATLAAIAWIASVDEPREGSLSRFFLLRQDSVLAAAIIAALLALSRMTARPRNVAKESPALAPAAIAALLFALAYAGHYLLLDGYDLSRDEQMANFDAYIFSHQRLSWPLAEEWRPFAAALNKSFLLPIEDGGAWVSAYLPANAALRALIGAVSDPALTSPLFLAIGAIALFRIVRRLWPDEPFLGLVALALYAGSGQILFTGMTSYAMSGHLALNLVWLWLFLMRRPLADAGALAIGFAATGLHQPLFHPMFAGPILTLTVFRREWARAGVYLAGYALIGAFWLYWPHFVSDAAGGAPAAGAADFLSRLRAALSSVRPEAIEHMLLNFIRLLTWQHLLFAPLLMLGIGAALRGGAFERALAASVVLPFPVMLVVLAYQGHGWGYRYEHAALGPAILLAVCGWRNLDWTRAAPRRLLAAASLITFFVLAPMQAAMMRGLYHPFAELDRMIGREAADVAVIEAKGAPFAVDLVINRPDLSNRPLRLIGESLKGDKIAALCKGGARVRFIDAPALAPIARAFGIEPREPDEDFLALQDAARREGCKAE